MKYMLEQDSLGLEDIKWVKKTPGLWNGIPTCYERGGGRNQFGLSCHMLLCSGMDLLRAELKLYNKEGWKDHEA